MRTKIRQAVITGGEGTLAQAVAQALQDPAWEILAPSRTALDLRDQHAISRYFHQHQPELLVCAAGIIKDAPITKTTEQDWDEVFAVNFTAAVACARAALPGMIAQGCGHIIFISSFSALHPPAGQLAYATAKAALLGLMAELATHHGPDNIRVNCILPGFLETRMTAEVSTRRRQEILAAHALQRYNTVAAVGKFIRHLHHELPHTSGQVFQLDSRAG
ncbi:MAG: SDR family oxidoreductase [Akkermansiaceae bacterium]